MILSKFKMSQELKNFWLHFQNNVLSNKGYSTILLGGTISLLIFLNL